VPDSSAAVKPGAQFIDLPAFLLALRKNIFIYEALVG